MRLVRFRGFGSGVGHVKLVVRVGETMPRRFFRPRPTSLESRLVAWLCKLAARVLGGGGGGKVSDLCLLRLRMRRVNLSVWHALEQLFLLLTHRALAHNRQRLRQLAPSGHLQTLDVCSLLARCVLFGFVSSARLGSECPNEPSR